MPVLTPANAQYVQFTENKGQWNSNVLFTGDAGASSVFLQKQGYKVLLNDTNDLKKIQGYYGGHQKEGASAQEHPGQGYAFVNSDGLSSSKIPGNNTGLVLHSHTYEVTFTGASQNPQVVADKAVLGYSNYFKGNDSTKWASGCKTYQAVLYKNMYPGIDVRYYTNNGQLKYDVVVNPGADISPLGMRITGASALTLKNGNLIIKTSVGSVTELAPVAYQVINNVKVDVDVKFSLQGNTVYFKTGNYSKTAALVIDPALVFATFTGSKSDNWGYTATFDASGAFYAGGIVFGNGYPVSTGAFQQNFGGGAGGEHISGHDVAIIKFSADGSRRIFATYLGGGANEQPHSMVADNTGSLIVAGRTNSADFPSNTARLGPGGGFDIFITKFSPDGSTLIGSKIIGGTGDDGVNEKPKESEAGAANTPIRRNYGDDARSEVIVDASNNIYLTTCTQSPDATVTNRLSTAGAFQQTLAGQQDGLIIKTDAALNLIFSSYLGGTGDDAGFVLALNPANNDIYVAGATTSKDLAAAGNASDQILHTAYQGGFCDGFISIISNDGSTLKKTVYVGGAGNDMLYGIQFDKLGFPYVMGTTTVSFPVINASFNSQSGGKQFITKLKPDLSSVEYSTNFGKGLSVPDISPVAFLVDRCENVYVSGWGGGINKGENYPNAGTNGLTVTANAIQPQTNGSNLYFFVLEKNGTKQLYGTFYGEISAGALGDHVDGGTSRFDKQGVIYQAECANCTATGNGFGFPTTAGTWSVKNQATSGSKCNEAAIKIAFQLAGVTAGIRTSINGINNDTAGCVPLTVEFTDTIGIAKQYVWNFGDGSSSVTTTSRNISHTFNNVGNYRVMLIAVDSMACNMFDTLYVTIRVRDDYAKVGFTSVKLPPCDSLKYQFTNTSVAPAGKPFGPQSLQWDFGDGTTLFSNAVTVTHSYSAPGTYTVALRLVDTSYCNAPDADSIQLRIATNVKAAFNVAPGCAPYDAAFENVSLGGQQFTWSFGDGTTSALTNPVHLYATPGTYTVKLIAADPSTCNKIDSITKILTVNPKPAAAFTFGPIPSLENTATNFYNGSTGGTHYLWDFGDGDQLHTIERDTLVSHLYNITGSFNVCLVAYNDYGCTDTACSIVQAIVLPLADVPSAFSPNGDGTNDEVHVRGYGVTKMNWMIFNRWGTLVFQSDSPSKGWNGYYKGKLQPQDVYNYVLDISFTDGKKYQKKGDITLLR